MASGSYAKKLIYQESPQTQIPPRATRPLSSVKEERETTKALPIVRPPKVIDEFEEHPLTRHIPWLRPFIVCMLIVIVSVVTLLSGVYFNALALHNSFFHQMHRSSPFKWEVPWVPSIP